MAGRSDLLQAKSHWDGALCKAASDRAVPDDRRAGEGVPRRFVGDYRRRREGAADNVILINIFSLNHPALILPLT